MLSVDSGEKPGIDGGRSGSRRHRAGFPLFGEDLLLDLTWIGDAVGAVHLALIEEANKHFNLTRITTPREAAISGPPGLPS